MQSNFIENLMITSFLLEPIVHGALVEDIGAGDITTALTVAATARAHGVILAKSAGVVAGLPVVEEVFRQVSAQVSVRCAVAEGAQVASGTILAKLDGPACALLTGERVALNFLQRMSGIATITAKFVEAVAGTSVRIVDTRKTTPGLRMLEKYAVTVGGGHNHRMGLSDAVMIKDNHIVAAGGISAAVARARNAIPHTMTITVECESLSQVEEALAAGADVLLLDNMPLPLLTQTVKLVKGRAIAEASGGVTLENIAAIAKTGVDVISVGALTHSAPALDISMDIGD